MCKVVPLGWQLQLYFEVALFYIIFHCPLKPKMNKLPNKGSLGKENTTLLLSESHMFSVRVK